MSKNACDAGGEGSGDFKDGYAEGWRAAITELATSHAVNHPVRLDCFAILLAREASGTEIADELDENLRTVCYHLDELHKSGVIRCVDTKRGGARRGASEYFYKAVTCAEVQDGEWTALPRKARREIAGRAFRAVVAMGLSSLRCEEMESDPLLRLIWMEVSVDAEGDQEIADFLEEANERAKALKARIEKRIGETGEKHMVRVISLLGFRRSDPGGWTKHKPQ
jgi:DNA-binding transcriptional ArsR family regulator